MRKVLLIEGDPDDAKAAIANLGDGIDVDWVNSLPAAAHRLELRGAGYYDQIIFDIGVAGTNPEVQNKAFSQLRKYNTPILCIAGDLPQSAKLITNQGGKLRQKSELFRNDDSLIQELGWEAKGAIEAERDRARERSRTVRKIEQTVAQNSAQIGEMINRLTHLERDFGVVKVTLTEIKKDVDFNTVHDRDREDRLEAIEDIMGAIRAEIRELKEGNANRQARMAGLTNLIGVLGAALITAIATLIITFLKK